MFRIDNIGAFLLCILICQTSASSDKHHHGHNDKLATPASVANLRECQLVQEAFSHYRIGDSSIVPNVRTHDHHLEICHNGGDTAQRKSCCTNRMERKYQHAAEKDFHEVMRSTSSYLKNLLTTNSVHYQDQFLNMIQTAHNNTEQLFREVYKIPRDGRRPLSSLFLDLESYIKRREVDIKESTDQFFDDLFPLVFNNIMNDPSVTDLSDDYRECLTEIRKDLYPPPFGAVTPHMKHHLSKSLATARAFLDALNLGIETINATDNIHLDPVCTAGLTRLTYCAHCEGYVTASPCKYFCYNVMRGCMAHVTSLDHTWNSFVDDMHALTKHMNGPYNMEEVMHSFHSKVSEAIMHAMESGHKFYTKVVTKCGHPKTSATAPSSEARKQRVEAAAQHIAKQDHKLRVKLHTKIEMFMRNLVASKGFYNNLADTLCSAEKFSAGLHEECWNGEALAPYNKSVVENTLRVQETKNPEVKAPSRIPTVMSEIQKKLDDVSVVLKSKVDHEMMQGDEFSAGSHNSHDGYHTYSGDGFPNDDDDYGGSGSGSGDGGYSEGRSQKHRNPVRRPGVKTGGDDDSDDIFIDERPSKTSSPYITQKPGASGPGQTAAILSYCPKLALLTLIMTVLLVG